jgi:hypothetical protein
MTACGEKVETNIAPESHGVAGGRGLCMDIKTAATGMAAMQVLSG